MILIEIVKNSDVSSDMIWQNLGNFGGLIVPILVLAIGSLIVGLILLWIAKMWITTNANTPGIIALIFGVLFFLLGIFGGGSFAYKTYQIIYNNKLEFAYIDVKANSTINNVVEDDTHDTQKIRFNEDGKNYYVHLNKNANVSTGDDIRIKGQHVLTTKESRDLHDLSYSFNDTPLKVIINHDGTDKEYQSVILTH